MAAVDGAKCAETDARKRSDAGCDRWGAQRLTLARRLTPLLDEYRDFLSECFAKGSCNENVITYEDWEILLRYQREAERVVEAMNLKSGGDPDAEQRLPKTGEYFMENGTLLGAWRSGKFIPHDDDFDFGLLVPSCEGVYALAFLRPLARFLEKKFEELGILAFQQQQKQQPLVKKQKQQPLPGQYQVRIRDAYCFKLEVYEPAFGCYTLLGERYQGADYPYVIVDLQLHGLVTTSTSRDPAVLGPLAERLAPRESQVLYYTWLYWAGTLSPHWRADSLVPTGPMEFEDTVFPAPRDPEAVMTELYGCLKQGAIFVEGTDYYLKPGCDCDFCVAHRDEEPYKAIYYSDAAPK